MDQERVGRVSRRILADILSVGSVLAAGPALSAAQEEEVLAEVQVRLHGLLERHGHEDDAALAARFRRDHPHLFEGSAADRHRAAKRARQGPKGD